MYGSESQLYAVVCFKFSIVLYSLDRISEPRLCVVIHNKNPLTSGLSIMPVSWLICIPPSAYLKVNLDRVGPIGSDVDSNDPRHQTSCGESQKSFFFHDFQTVKVTASSGFI